MKKSFQQHWIYRVNSYNAIISSFFFAFIQMSVWRSLVNTQTVKGITIHDMIYFVFINMIISSLINSNIGVRMADKIYDGSIAVDFIRPIEMKYYFISQQIGENLFRTMVSSLPVSVVFFLFLKLQVPEMSALRLVLFSISLFLGIIIIYLIHYILGMLRFFSIYLAFIKIKIVSMIEHRGAFLSAAMAQMCSYAAQFLLVWIMIQQFGTIGGWKPYEVLLLFGLNLLSYALAGLFLYDTFTGLSSMVQSGEFDDALTKPLNPFLYLTCRGFQYGYISHISLSVFVIAISFSRLNIDIMPLRLIFILVTALSGALIQGAVFIFTSVPAFWFIQSTAL